jgi:molecular chaperone DnaK
MNRSDAARRELSQPPIGIDLGTTFSVLAYLDATGRPTTVRNRSGDLLTPSSVLFEDDNVVVGKEACKNSLLAPDSYAEYFKRDMGMGHYRRRVRGQQVHPEVLSAFVLDRLKRDAETKLGPIHRAVITVPAFFDELRRKATQDAGRLAGLDVLDIINEPTAAALSFGFQQGMAHGSGPPKRILVYDLGGGTFDVTILEIQGNTFRTLATDGDVCLGGKEFDERLVNHLAEKFLAAHGVDPRSDSQDALQLWRDAEDAKHALSERSKTTVVCFHAGIRMRIDVTRAEFEEITCDLIERTRSTTSLVLQQAGLGWSGIDRILLVGGSVQMPMVSSMLVKLSGQEPDRSSSPGEAVAHGAALYAGMLSGGWNAGSDAACRLINVNSHSLGVIGTDPRTKRKVRVVLIPKNTPLPHHATRKFRTSDDDLRSVELAVVEGESSQPDQCIALGKCVVRDLAPGLPKGTEVIVEFTYESNGRLSVLARIPRTRQSAQVHIVREKQNKLEDLNFWRVRLCEQSEPPRVEPFAESKAPSASPTAPKEGATDRAQLMQRLDAMYVKLGQRATRAAVPAALIAAQQAALNAGIELEQLKSALARAEEKQRSATGRTEAVQGMSDVAQARLAAKQAETRAGFSLLVLGRECERQSFEPPGREREMREIHRIKSLLG